MKLPVVSLLLATVALGACTHSSMTGVEASRVDTDALYFFNDAVTDGPVVARVDALQVSAQELVQTSRVTGALVGAAVGCGVTALTGSGARDCLVTAAVTGTGGALIGAARGEREVTRRVTLIAEADVARTLNGASQQMQSIRTDLPQFLAAQEAELNSLTMQLIRGEIDQQTHDIAVLKIEGERLALAEALEMTARDARRASANLQQATRRGQTGLGWHIGATTQLADDVESTRASFSLF